MATNLLPSNQKEEIKSEVLQKKISLILFFLGANICFLTAIILSFLFYISKENTQVDKKIITIENQIAEPQFDVLKKQINTANQNLNKISNTKKEQVSSVDVLEKISSLVPSEIYLKSFTFQNTFKGTEDKETKEMIGTFFAKITISGVSQNRETLFLFKKSLDQEKSFQNVYFDPSSWVKPTNAEFSLDFNYFPDKN
jgi:Tfp pilus assembly protein PilN